MQHFLFQNCIFVFSFSVLWIKCWMCRPWSIWSQFCFCGGSHICALYKCRHPTLPSEARRWVLHMGCAGSSATRAHLRALSSCSNSFSFQWSRSQISGRSEWLIRCWSARDCGEGKKQWYYSWNKRGRWLYAAGWIIEGINIQHLQVNIVKSAILLTDVQHMVQHLRT